MLLETPRSTIKLTKPSLCCRCKLRQAQGSLRSSLSSSSCAFFGAVSVIANLLSTLFIFHGFLFFFDSLVVIITVRIVAFIVNRQRLRFLVPFSLTPLALCGERRLSVAFPQARLPTSVPVFCFSLQCHCYHCTATITTTSDNNNNNNFDNNLEFKSASTTAP